MKANGLILLGLFLVSLSTWGQSDLEEKIKKEGLVKGYVVTDKGDKIDGYFKRMGTVYANGNRYHAGWEFQGDIKFIDLKTLKEESKIKNKHYEKYKPKDLNSYKYDTLVYEAIKYSELGSIGIGALAGTKLLRKIVDGQIDVYEHYGTPPPVASGSEGFEPYYRDLQEPAYIYRVGDDEDGKNITQLNVKKELDDCPTVVEKYENNEYNVVGKKGEEASGLAKLANKMDYREEVRIEVVKAYNETCH